MNQVQKNKQTIPQNLTLNESVDPFGANVYASLSYKKMERIVVALHLITNKLPEGDSTRLAIRDTALSMLKDTLVLKDGFQSTGAEALNTVVSHIRLALSYVDILQVRGVLSETNAEVIKNACGRFVAFLNTAEHARFAESLELTDEYFGGVENERPYEKTERSPAPLPVKHLQKVAHVGVQSSSPLRQAGVLSQEPQSSTRTEPTVSVRASLPESADRRSGILAVIDARGKATVKDIAGVVTGCSEKTLQRELNTMIAEGVVRKVGERRWTTYFKAS